MKLWMFTIAVSMAMTVAIPTVVAPLRRVSAATPDKIAGEEFQEYTGAKEHSGGRVDPDHAVHERVIGRGVRVLPRRAREGQGRQED